MSWRQLVTPSPRIPCRPGWCLEYVRKAFGQAARYDTATEAWEASRSQHRDQAFPAAWVPLWFAIAGVPAGHVVLRAPDGSIYSTTDPYALTPVHHPNLADLLHRYAAAGLPLTYLGWSEDIAGTPVVTKEDADMPITEKEFDRIFRNANENGDRVIRDNRAQIAAVAKLINPDIDEAKLAEALLAQGDITITKGQG